MSNVLYSFLRYFNLLDDDELLRLSWWYEYYVKGSPREFQRRMPWFFHGADRLDFSTAVRAAHPKKQNYTSVPRLWFIDAWYRCQRCEEEFLWSVEEQEHWFETLGLRVDSMPHLCRSCRHEVDERTDLRKRYDSGIKNSLLKTCSADRKNEMLRIIDRIEELSNTPISDKMSENRRILEKHLHQCK